MLDAKTFSIDGVDYEINTYVDVARKDGKQIAVNKATGEERVADEIGTDVRIPDPPFWELKLPDGWELEPSHSELDEHPILSKEIYDIFEESGLGAAIGTAKAHRIPTIDTSQMEKDGYIITARREGKLIGVMDAYLLADANERGTRGKLNKAVVLKDARKETQQSAETRPPVSENIMRLAILALMNEGKCNTIITEPATKQGERFSKRNGFIPDKDIKGYHTLSQEIIEEIRKEMGEDGQFRSSEFQALLEKIRPRIAEIVAESEYHFDRR